jgi:two-component system, LytTR family, response regulator
MRALIIEDEIAGQELLKKNISENFPECKVIAISDNVNDAVKQINTLKPDLIFLDIQIKGGTGFDVLKQITERTFEVIFITAHNNYTIQALRAQAVDYLLKPINKKDFIEALNRVSKIIDENKKNVSAIPGNFLSVYTSSGAEFIKYEDIVFLEADGAYTTIHMLDNHILSTKNIGEYESVLPNPFFRCHHSFIININHIKKFEKGRSGLLIMKNGHTVPVSQRKMKEFSVRVI